jgi:tape measure domain-containing protein
VATNLQVNANTTTAVGAFNALANSIAGARGQFSLLTTSAHAANAAGRSVQATYTSVGGAFDRLTAIASRTATTMRLVAGGVELVVGAVLKELDKLQGFQAIMSVTTGSAADTARSYDFLRGVADKLGVQFDALTSNYAKLVAALPEGPEGLKLAENAFLGVARAARTMHSTNADTQLMFYAITQMASKGVVSMEELRRQLGEKLPGVMQIAARSLNTTPELLEAAIRKGTVNSIKFLEYFSNELNRTFRKPAELAASSVSAAMNRLTNVWVDFVKKVLDSGAGQSLVNLFDAIREKLSDPYVIERFALFIKNLADQVTQMVKGISATDIRQGFDTFSTFVQQLTALLGGLIKSLTWIINNAPAAGAVMGAIGGAALGMKAGPYGALAGVVVGGAGGYAAGRSLQPSAADQAALRAANAAASAAALVAAEQQSATRQAAELFKMTQLIPKLQEFKALSSLSALEPLMVAERMNTKTIEDLNKILSGKEFKTDKAKLDALMRYSETGSTKIPSLADVLGTGKPKKESAEDRSLRSSGLKAMGFNPDFTQEFQNYRKMLERGTMSERQYNDAVDDLLSKQPLMIEAMKERRKEQDALNKASIDAQDIADYQMSKLRGPEAQIEAEVAQRALQYKERGLEVSEMDRAAWREIFKIIDESRRVSAVATDAWARTVGRNQPRDEELAGLQRNLADPSGQFTKTDASNYLSQQYSSQMEGTAEFYAYQKQLLTDWYVTIDKWRQADLIKEETAQQLKLKAAVNYEQLRLSQASGFFGNLAVLTKSSNQKIAAIGKAAAIVQATIDGTLAIQRALTAAPPPWNFVLAAGVAVQTGANIAAIRSQGYMSGGYTGNGPVNEVAGQVHRREFVFDAAAVRRIGVNNLEAIRAGTAMSRSAVAPAAPMESSSKGSVRIVNVLDPAIVGDYLSSPDGDMVLVNAIRRNKDSIDNL